MEKKFIITTIVTNFDTQKWAQDVANLEECKEITEIHKGVNMVPVMQGNQPGISPMPYALIRYKATESEYKSYMFNLKLQM